MANGLDDIAAARLPLGANHRGAFRDAAQRLTQVAAAAHEGRTELTLVDMMLVREEEGKLFGVIVLAESLAETLSGEHLQGVKRDDHGHIESKTASAF